MSQSLGVRHIHPLCYTNRLVTDFHRKRPDVAMIGTILMRQMTDADIDPLVATFESWRKTQHALNNILWSGPKMRR